MPTVSGRIVFDINRNININGNVTELNNLPVVLQDTASLARLVVLTDATGAYSFINVPAGSYRIVESYGLGGGVPTPGDFATAVVGPLTLAQTPPIGSIPSPPAGATNVDCVTPDTILITVATADVTEQNIFNGPVAYIPLSLVLDPCTIVLPANLVTDADGGTFGAFPAGTTANQGTPANPYPTISPDFTYVAPDPSTYTPFDGEFTIQNTMNNAMSNTIGAWWRISDHTSGNETGRMMIVNENDPGDIIFRTTVSVAANTTYLFSTWIMNLFRVEGFPGPQFAVRILDEEQTPLYEAALGAEIPANEAMPEWKEIGSAINSQNNTQLVIEFFSQGEAAVGNDFAIDDIALRQVILPQFELIKTESHKTASIGDTVTYTVTLDNICQQPLSNVYFSDFIPPGLNFVAGSVVVNGAPNPMLNPLIGFIVPDIAGGSGLQVSFRAQVTSVPTINPTVNTATVRYLYSPIPDGIADVYFLSSNEVALLVEVPPQSANLIVQKTANRKAATMGERVMFSISVSNLGPDAAQNVFLVDPLPSGITQPEYSIDNGLTWQPWSGVYSIGTLLNGGVAALMIRGIVSGGANQNITNTASVTSTTPDPNPASNTARASFWVLGCIFPNFNRCCPRRSNGCPALDSASECLSGRSCPTCSAGSSSASASASGPCTRCRSCQAN